MASETIKELAPKIKQAIDGANKILLHLHPSPDGDSFGSGLAMTHALTAMGKDVTLIKGDSNLPNNFAHLPGFEKIVSKNYFEIDLSQFDLFIIQDAGAPSQISNKAEVLFPKGLKTVVIDHHASTVPFGDINLIDPKYPAVCQMLYELFTEWGIEITKDMATCLMLGVYTDTGGFKWPSTRADTFFAASELAKIQSEFSKTILKFEHSNSPGRIRFIGLALSNINLYFGGKVAISAVSLEQLQKAGISKDDTQKTNIGAFLQSVIGWELGIGLIESEANFVRCGFRTRDAEKHDVNKLAVVIGGGGHKGAAGAEIKKPLGKARMDVLTAIEKTFPDLGKA